METIPEALRNLLRCPVSFGSLREATGDECRAAERLSGRICTSGLVSSDGKHFYPVQDGIPLLVPESAVHLPILKSALAMEEDADNLTDSER